MARTALLLTSLVLLATLPFLGGVQGEFIEDDLGIIRDNADLREGGELLGVWTDNYWGEIWGGLYRPLTVFSYGVDRVVFGADEDGAPAPWGVHTTNLLINAGCAVLVFFVLRRCFGAGSAWPAWIGAALFAAHPAHVEAVVHLVGRADLLAAFFFLAAWLAHGSPDRSEEQRPWRWWLGGGLFLLSLLSKEAGAALPAVLFFEAGLLGPKRSLGEFLKSQVLPLAPYATALVVFLVVRGLVLGGEMDPPQTWTLYSAGGYVAFSDPAAYEVPLTMTHALAEYLVLLVAPLRLSADYSGFPHHVTPTMTVIGSAIVLGALVSAAARAARRGNRQPLTWTSVFVWTILPVSNLVVVSGIVMAERVIYLPSIAAAGLAAAAMPWLLARNKALITVPFVVLGLFVARTAVRAPVWSDAQTLFEETVRNGRHHGHLALTGICDVYVRELQSNPEADPVMLPALLGLARESVESHRTTINTAHLAWALEASGELDEALREWGLAESIDPGRRADVQRCLMRIRVQVEDVVVLRSAVEVARANLAQAQGAGDRVRAGFWSAGLVSLLESWITRAASGEAWLEAMSGCALLMQVQPANQVLLKNRIPAFEGAIRALETQGRDEEARGVATELDRFDPGNPVATSVLE